MDLADKFKIEELEKDIEFHIGNVNMSPPGSRTYKFGSMLIKDFQRQYIELTGHEYKPRGNLKNRDGDGI